MSKILPFQYVINIKIINDKFYIFFHTESSKHGVCFILNSTFQYRSTTFQVVDSHMWLLVTILERAGPDLSV